jgi:glycerate 2-kinase
MGVKKVLPHADIILLPIADGGDGTLQILYHHRQAQKIHLSLKNALGEKIATHYLIHNDTAIIEVASICGLAQIPPALCNPAFTTSYGVGEAILDALDKNIRRFLICLGGSATNDAGAGMLQALGCRFLDKTGQVLPQDSLALRQLHTIDTSKLDVRLKEASFEVACDVSNTLLGKEGATMVYAPQKGAAPIMVKQLEQAMRQYAKVIKKEKHLEIGALPYAGSAGGIASALFALLNATLYSGIQLIFALIEMEKEVEKADLIITGEGRLDGQTLYDKGIAALAHLALKYQKPLIAIPGSLGQGYAALHEIGVSKIVPLISGSCDMPVDSSTLLCVKTQQTVESFILESKHTLGSG